MKNLSRLRLYDLARRKNEKAIHLKSEYDRLYRSLAKRKIAAREQRLKKYGLTPKSYNKMVESQKGVCAICATDPYIKNNRGQKKTLVIDHCHDTGKVRGLLCDKCNRAIGLLGDDYNILLQAICYIKNGGFNG